MLYWLQNGVDGFRVDAVAHLFEAESFEDEPPGTGTGYHSLDHTLTTFQPETYEILTEWREILDAMTKDDSKDRLLMVEAYANSPNQTLQLLNYNDKPGAHISTNMALIDLKTPCDATCIRDKVNSFMDPFDGMDLWPNWQTGNHDVSCLVTRMGGDQDQTNIINMILMTLPGTAFTYYGEEIGMHDVEIPDDKRQDKVGVSFLYVYQDASVGFCFCRLPTVILSVPLCSGPVMNLLGLPLVIQPGYHWLMTTEAGMLRRSLPMELA
jgi:glycosidase